MTDDGGRVAALEGEPLFRTALEGPLLSAAEIFAKIESDIAVAQLARLYLGTEGSA